MNPNDLADATVRALALLPPDDPACSDPRLLRDPQLIEEARATREAAADVWLAVSPLRVAPPEVLQTVLAEIRPDASIGSRSVSRFLPWLAASGWAAAAVVAFCLWTPDAERRPTMVVETTPGKQPTATQSTQPSRNPRSRNTSLQSDILRLQAQLADLGEDKDPGSRSPRVITLNSPSAVSRTPEEARSRVRAILTDALHLALEAESGAPADPASLVIERGWLPGAMPELEEGGVVRHRNFPEHDWQKLGLRRSDDGEYYDASNQLLWSPDPEGRGFIGRKITQQDDLARFKSSTQPDEPPVFGPRMLPEGFVIENPEDKSSDVIIDQVPAPSEGTEQLIVWNNSFGVAGSMSVGSVKQPMSLGGGSGTLVLTVPNSTGMTSFQLVERPLIPNGQPDRVIVEGSK